MLQKLLDHQLDVLGFVALLGIATLAVHLWLRRRHGSGLRLRTWVLLGTIACWGAAGARLAGWHEQSRLRDMLQGIAPTYAREMELMGHAGLPLDAKPDDARYVAMIAAEIRWEKANRNVSDIYTFRKRADGKIVLVVDSETDYDHD